MQYPVQVYPDAQGGVESSQTHSGIDSSEWLALNVNSTYLDDTFIEYLPESSEIGKSNTTFGGLAKYL